VGPSPDLDDQCLCPDRLAQAGHAGRRFLDRGSRGATVDRYDARPEGEGRVRAVVGPRIAAVPAAEIAFDPAAVSR
jgi:hypothetical protein